MKTKKEIMIVTASVLFITCIFLSTFCASSGWFYNWFFKPDLRYQLDQDELQFCSDNKLGYDGNACWNAKRIGGESGIYNKGFKFEIISKNGSLELGKQEKIYDNYLPKKIYFSNDFNPTNFRKDLKNPMKEFCESQNGTYEQIRPTMWGFVSHYCYLEDDFGISNKLKIKVIDNNFILTTFDEEQESYDRSWGRE